MPTVKIDINSGIESYPTDGIDSSVKLHNFTVGSDGSLYKLPVLKNLKTVEYQNVGTVGPNTKIVPYRIQDLRKFQTSVLNNLLDPGADTYVDEMLFYRRIAFLTTGSYGVVDIDYQGNRVGNLIPTDKLSKFGEFEYNVYNYEQGSSENTDILNISSLNPQIIVDFNAQYTDETDRNPTSPIRCIFPMQHMFESKESSGYELQIQPRNMINCTMDATAGSADVQSLSLEDNASEVREFNDLARGAILIGNRMGFYSALENCFLFSPANSFSEIAETNSLPVRVVPPEEIQGLTEFNGNIIAFTPTGINRWVLSPEDTEIIQRDPTFNYDHRIRYSGSYVVADRNLYFYTDDFQVYRMASDFTVSPIFEAELPFYKPLETYLGRDQDLPVSYVSMLGYKFISFGPWLYNIDTNKWSTYRLDGYNKPESDTTGKEYLLESTTIAGSFCGGTDDIIATHSSICTPLSYKQMQDLPDNIEPSWVEGEYNFGEVAFFTTRMYQDEQQFSLDGVMAYVRGGTLSSGSKMWLKVLRGSDEGDFDLNDESTYGVEATYSPIDASTIGQDQSSYVGRFEWRCMNLKTDRFRLQFVTKEKKGIVVEAVLANITTRQDSQEYLVNEQQRKQPKEE